jgi:hypothetical protein
MNPVSARSGQLRGAWQRFALRGNLHICNLDPERPAFFAFHPSMIRTILQ